MLIGIDATRANKTQKTGVEWYAWHVIQELKKLTAEDGHSWVLYSNAPLEGGLEHCPKNWFERRIGWPFPYGWTQFRLSEEMLKRRADVLFMPGSTLPRKGGRRTVVTVHDVGFRRYPQIYKKRQVRIHDAAMKEIKRRASTILTVSEFSKKEIVSVYGVEPERIHVTYNGIDHDRYRPITHREDVEERVHRYQLAKPYFLTVGRLEAKKNIVNLIRAFSVFKSRAGVGDPHTLVLVGMPGFGYEEIKSEMKRSPAAKYIVELGYVPEADLPALMNAAEALIHPSWYEGFGLPPIQAMACGCPVIASEAGSLPEVVGDGNGLLFPPQDSAALANEISRLVRDTNLAERLRTRGIQRAAAFTWARTAKETRDVLLADI